MAAPTPVMLRQGWRMSLVHLGYRRRRSLMVGVHLALTTVAYWLAFGLRFDFAIGAGEVRRFWATLPFLVVLRGGALDLCGASRGSWRHVSVRDLVAIVLAASSSSLAFVVMLFFLNALGGMPRSVLVLDWMVFIVIAGGARFALRLAREGGLPAFGQRGPRTLVIGAGQGAERFLREHLHGSQRASMTVIGLLDDSVAMQGVSLHGVRVLGPIERLPEIARQQEAELLVIAIPSATGEQMRRILTLCGSTGVEFKLIPSLRDLIDGGAPGQLRNVEVEDLLGRDPVYLDMERLERDLAGRSVLVTGGAGSIGSELARQIAGFCPARLVLLEQAESPLYFIHLELSASYPGIEVIPIVGDITDATRVEEVFARHRPDYVFHAAAYKHVPMMEANVAEAVRNNVLGTLRVAECAARYEARRFVLISTDKAVNPSSVMGATKRVAERIVLGWPTLRTSRTDFRAVRFGNVLDSDGSVIPLFRRQLAKGGPLTVTHPDVRRYFMSIPEAVQLVLHAAALPQVAGRIAMLDMGQPVRIVDLAEQLIRLSGRTPYTDVHIEFTGLRPGEKLDEELMSLLETSSPTDVDKIRVVRTDEPDAEALEAGLFRIVAALPRGEPGVVLRELCALVPEYRPRATVEREQPITIETDLLPPSPSRVSKPRAEIDGAYAPLLPDWTTQSVGTMSA